MQTIKRLSLVVILFGLMPLILVLPDNANAQSGGNGASGKGAKINFDLSALSQQDSTRGQSPESAILSSTSSYLPVSDDSVLIDAVASGDANDLLADLEALGLQGGSAFGQMVSGRLPISAIDEMESLDSLKFARPAYVAKGVGTVTSEGDAAMNADDARANFSVDGTGSTVGTLSDSYDCLGGAATDVAAGDLPAGIVVLEESPSCVTDGSDEGRAMMQIIHDVAPGAAQMFHTASTGQAGFAQGIIDLANAGADVIVDDVAYLAEPFFQDGIIAQAVDDVVTNDNVAYFSAAGNSGRDSYDATFVAGDTFTPGQIPNERGAPPFGGGVAHDFGGGDFFQSVTIPQGDGLILSFQWDEPFFSVSGNPGATNDVDIYLLNNAGSVVAGAIDDNINVTGDAVEVFGFVNGTNQTNFDIMITHFAGAAPGTMKYIMFSIGSPSIPGVLGSTVFGHTNATNAESVGASFFGTPFAIEFFSSAGPTPILFETDGTPIPGGEIRNHPDIVGPDGVSTSVPGFASFFGTSAAAPHAAGVAALIRDMSPGLSPSNVYSLLESTAIDMDDPSTAGFDTGYDFGTGFGFIQADAAVQGVAPQCNGLTATMVGTENDDVLIGTNSDDVIVGLGGGDVIIAMDGDDTVCAGRGGDVVIGGDGDDTLFGEQDTDFLSGGDGNDILNGASGDDVIQGFDGSDDANCGGGSDYFDGGPRTDRELNCEILLDVP